MQQLYFSPRYEHCDCAHCVSISRVGFQGRRWGWRLLNVSIQCYESYGHLSSKGNWDFKIQASPCRQKVSITRFILSTVLQAQGPFHGQGHAKKVLASDSSSCRTILASIGQNRLQDALAHMQDCFGISKCHNVGYLDPWILPWILEVVCWLVAESTARNAIWECQHAWILGLFQQIPVFCSPSVLRWTSTSFQFCYVNKEMWTLLSNKVQTIRRERWIMLGKKLWG